ncbi:MAG: polyprenyl synthetase family protein [Saprospirales bacterium]|nr:polyprenyl synthetase family protein [Saprospirales bacterium]
MALRVWAVERSFQPRTILDTFGNAEKVGKIGGDIAQNKKTFLILKALEIALAAEKNRLHDLMHGKETGRSNQNK